MTTTTKMQLLTKCCNAPISYQQEAINFYAGTEFVPDGDLTDDNWDSIVSDYGTVFESDAIDGGDFLCAYCGNEIYPSECYYEEIKPSDEEE